MNLFCGTSGKTLFLSCVFSALTLQSLAISASAHAPSVWCCQALPQDLEPYLGYAPGDLKGTDTKPTHHPSHSRLIYWDAEIISRVLKQLNLLHRNIDRK